MNSLRLLVITYAYPPAPFVGSNRWAAMVAHLRKLGHEVAVVTVSSFGRLELEIDVIRTPDLFAIPALRRLLVASAQPGAGEPSGGFAPPPLHELLLVPDPKLLGWLPPALAAVRRILRARRFDCLITASPFESTHLVGLMLGTRRPAWVADLRDGWTFEPWRAALPWSAQRRLDRWLEERTLIRADAVSAASEAVAAELERRLRRRIHHVANGWDPDLEPAVVAAGGPTPDASRVTLVYTGSLWKTVGQDPSPLLAALARLRRESPELSARLELMIAGPLSGIEAQRLQSFELDGIVRHVGHLARLQAIALQRRADALILITSRHRNVVTGKIFEYLAAGRPILALARDDEAAAMIRATGTGIVVPLDDEVEIMRALCDAAAGKFLNVYQPRGLEAYRYPAPARAMLDVVREAIARRAVRA